MKNNSYISWDFDGTLYDNKTNSINHEALKIFNHQRAEGQNVCITTARSYDGLGEIKRYFPDVLLFNTSGADKGEFLKNECPVPISKHYDNRLDVCQSLVGSDIKPIFVQIV